MTDQVAGTVLSERYALEDRIGVGGMASVYRAIDLTTGRRVAVKILSREFLARNPKEADRNVKRFRREAEILKLLVGNAYVVQIIEHGVAPTGDHFIAMELLEGEQLRFYIGRGKAAMGLRTFVYYARHLIRGLSDIHAKNLIHRDLAPDNVVIVKTREGLPWPKFLDFGIGKSITDELDQVTQMLTIMGKPQYFSPEQARGEELGTRSDVYSLGVLLYEMLTGFVPIEVHGLSDLRQIQKELPTPIGNHREGARVPADLQETVMRCLDKTAQNRPDLDEVLAAVERFSDRLDAGEEFPMPSEAPHGGTPGTQPSDEETHQAMPDELGSGSHEFSQGETIGRFQVRERIARGGMGLVYLAWDPILQREVAIKVATRVEEEKARRAILREARASSHLKSDNIVTIYDAGTEGGAPYIAMEYVRGRTLAQIIEEEGPLNGDRFWKIARGVLDGLIYAHAGEKPVIHRDLKPANILVRGDVAKIADFGIATVTAGQHLTVGGRDHSQTGGGAEGSVLTISPEQANNKPADHRSDVYSLGCVFYMMVTGKAPFQGNQIAILYQHVTKTPAAPSKVNPAVPPGVEPVIMRCLEKDPARRYQSVAEVKADLEPLFGDAPASRPARRSRLLVATAYVLILAVAGALAFTILAGKLGPSARVFSVVRVAGTTYLSDRTAEPFVTNVSLVPIELATEEGGEVRATVSADGVAPLVQTFALGSGRTMTVSVKLPDVPGRPLATFKIVLDRLDNPGRSRTELAVIRDALAPRVFFHAYGSDYAPSRTTPIRVARLQDLSAIVEDAGGLDEEGKITRAEVEWGEYRHNITFTRKRQDSESGLAWLATIGARDRAGNRTTEPEQVVKVFTPLVTIEAPAEREATARNTVQVKLRARVPEKAIKGLDSNDLDLGDGAFRVRLVIGNRPLPSVAMTRVTGGYVADLSMPPEHADEFEFEIEPLFEGEALKPSRYRFDSKPPVITAECGGNKVTSKAQYLDRPTLSVQVLGSRTEEIACRLEDGPAGIEGATVDVRIDGGRPIRVRPESNGTFHLPPVEAEEFVALLSASDQAGNKASTEFRVVRKGLQVTSVQLGGRDPDADGRIFVPDELVGLRVAAAGVAPDDQAFAKVFDEKGVERDSVKLDRLEGAHLFGTPEVRLVPAGAAWAVRTLRIVFGKDEASARAYAGDYTVICDREPPSISVTVDGTTDEVRNRSANRFSALRVRIADNVALAEKNPEKLVTWVRGNLAAPDVTLEPTASQGHGPGEEVSFLIGAPPGPPVENRFEFTIEAKDRAGRASSRTFAVQVTTPDVALVSVADQTSLAQFGESPAKPLVLTNENFVVSVRAPKDPASAYTLVVMAFPDGGAPVNREFPISRDSGTVLDFVVPLPQAGTGRLLDRGRLVFLLEDAASARPDELATIYYLFDREPPSWTVWRGNKALNETEARDLIKVASLGDLRIEATDGRGVGFDSHPVQQRAGVVGRIDTQRPDQVTLWLKDDEAFKGMTTRTLDLSIRDAAGNVAPIGLNLARSKEKLEIKQFLLSDGREPLFRREENLMVLAAPKVDVVVDDEAVGFQSVQWVVKRAVSPIRDGIIELGEDRPLPRQTIEWPGAEGAEPYLLEFYAQGPKGIESAPFKDVRVLVDAHPPNIYLQARGEVVVRGARTSIRDFEDLRLDVNDPGAGVGPNPASAELVSPAGRRIQATLAQSREGELWRIVPASTPTPGEWSVLVTARDRLGNSETRPFDVLLTDPVHGMPTTAPVATPATRPGPGGERTVASDALREQDEERTGIRFKPVRAAADRSGSPRFFMSQTEVTNEQFLRFVEALRKDPGEPIPRELKSVGDLAPIKKKVEDMSSRFADFRKDPALPVVGVDPEVALAFAAWTGGRLPARAEWTGAAGRYLLSDAEYPVYLDHGVAKSGEYWMRDPNTAVFQRAGTREVRRQPVSDLLRFQANAPFGLVGLAGNVAEWVTAEPGSRRVVGTMGGSFQYPYTNEVSNPRLDREPHFSAADAGIRVLWPAGARSP